jgi:hypothetical protein
LADVQIRHVRAVAGAVVLLWRRELARVLGTTQRAITGLIVCSAALAAAMGIMLATVAASQVTTEIPAELRAQVLRTSFTGAAMTAGVIGVALCLSAPARTAIQNVLDLVPVGHVPARIGQLAPVFVAGGLYAVCISSTSIFILVRSSGGPVSALWGLACYLFLIQVSLALTISAFTALQTVANRAFRLPSQYSTAIAGFAAIALVLATSAPDILATAPREDSWGAQAPPSHVLSQLAANPDAASAIGAFVWAGLAASAVWLSSRSHRPSAQHSPLRLLHGSSPARRRPSWGHIWTESLLALRNPQYLATAMALPVAVAAVWALVETETGRILVPSLAGAVIVFPCMLPLYAVGRTLPTHWIANLALPWSFLWVWTKLLASLMASFSLALPAASALLLLGLITPEDLGPIGIRGILAIAIAICVGAAVPYSEQQPMSIIVGGFLLGVVYVLASLGSALLAANFGEDAGTGMTAGMAAVSLGVYAVLSRRLSSREPARV